MDDRHAALLLASLALAGAGVRWVTAPRERAPGDLSDEAKAGSVANEPVSIEARSESMSPDRLSVTMTSSTTPLAADEAAG
jgi:hypothetical protein